MRVSPPRLLPGGGLILYNGGPCELRLYDQSARLLSQFGRCGRGPGGFDNFRGLWPWRGDSLFVVDQLPNRYSVFDRAGVLGRTGLVPRDADLPLPFVSGVLGEGALVVTGSRSPAGRPGPGLEEAALSVACRDRGWWRPFPGVVSRTGLGVHRREREPWPLAVGLQRRHASCE